MLSSTLSVLLHGLKVKISQRPSLEVSDPVLLMGGVNRRQLLDPQDHIAARGCNVSISHSTGLRAGTGNPAEAFAGLPK